MITKSHRKIDRSDILPIDEYEKRRKDNKQKLIALKRDRRVAVGPYATFYFENYHTMWSQVHEMLFIERGGEAQIADELSAYNPLIPQGSEFVATFMIEIDDPIQRERILYALGYVEDKVYLTINGDKCHAVPEMDVERTTAEGKTSAIHFMHFPLSDRQKNLIQQDGADLILGIEHENYGHMARLSEANRLSLIADLDL